MNLPNRTQGEMQHRHPRLSEIRLHFPFRRHLSAHRNILTSAPEYLTNFLDEARSWELETIQHQFVAAR
jgi:hypothetical protein